MPELLLIEVHRSEQTGKYYLEFIDHSRITPGNDGLWTDREIAEETFTGLLKTCYPQWDGSGKVHECKPRYDIWCNGCDVECSVKEKHKQEAEKAIEERIRKCLGPYWHCEGNERN